MSSIFLDGLVKSDSWKYFDLKFSPGVGNSTYDRVTELRDKVYGETIWRVESCTFSCCGTSAFEKLEGEYKNEEMAQEFLAIVLEYSPYYGKGSWQRGFKNHNDVWMVDAGYNIRGQLENSFFNLLVKLGAKEVYTFPNRAHGPEYLSLYTWNPQDCVEQLKEYLYFPKIENKWGRPPFRFIPLYLKDTYENEQQELEEKRQLERAEIEAHALEAAPARVVVPAKADQALERGLDGAVGIRNVRPVQWTGFQQFDANQNLKNWVDLNPNRNPAKRGI